jgi:hypothetical protein
MQLYEGRTEGGQIMEGGYAAWMGQPVVLRVVAGNMRVPLRGRLMSETNEIVRLRIADSWDVDIFKSMVVGVEHDNPVYVVNWGGNVSALANNGFTSERDAEVIALSSSWEDTNMRARLETLRDTILVVALQMIFRATIVMRRWNY